MGPIPTLGSSKMRQTYSRLQSVEEKRNVRKALFLIVLTAAAVFVLAFIGIPLFGRLTVFLSDLRGGSKAISKNDTIPPGPPRFNYLPAFTNQQTINVTGGSEAGATVKLTFNGNPQEVLVDKDGNFTFNLQLKDGENNLSAIAVDPSGNQSQKSKEGKITFDNKPPTLTVSSPTDGSNFFGSNQRQATIQGTTEVGCQVLINDRIVSVDDNGSFQYTTTLNDGANPFAVKSTDQAGNTTEKDITLNFTS
ncbi:MAG: Ig-like domain-containing protein [Candidatus Woesebacteria bacterium]|nr:Ig-like domain-containing protein [Candidatus Woesebacteria bacterium]